MSRYLFLLLFFLVSQESLCQLQLSKIVINGSEVPFFKGSIRMKASEDDLLLEFKYNGNNGLTYEYQLSGLESKWIKTAYPTARYRELPGGEYIFKLRALHHGKPEAVIQVRVSKTKAFWNEVWFIPSLVIYVLVLIGVGIYLFFLYDFRQKLKMQNVRNQIAADLHDEVGSNLNSIAIFVEVLRKNAPADMLPILEKIIANSRESVSLMQDTVWTINPKNDSVSKLFERMNSFASQVLSSKDIAFSFNVQPDLIKAEFSMEQRKNLYLIYKEAINNIVKHAHASKVNVEITSFKDQMEIIIEDNGQGFDTTEAHEGNGLYNFRERANEAEIDLLVESERDYGTKICLKIAG